MQPITTLFLVLIVSLSISIKSEFIDSDSFPILRSFFVSWYCRDSCLFTIQKQMSSQSRKPSSPLKQKHLMYKTSQLLTGRLHKLGGGLLLFTHSIDPCSSRFWFTSQLIPPAGQQHHHPSGVCPPIQG